MDNNLGRKLVGALLAVLVALGFEFENAWVFLGGSVLFMAWLGFVLLGPDT